MTAAKVADLLAQVVLALKRRRFPKISAHPPRNRFFEGESAGFVSVFTRQNLDFGWIEARLRGECAPLIGRRLISLN
jgi:hypothetical protein